MKILAIVRERDSWGDFRGKITIEIDGAVAFCVFEGEPEDNNLGRNFWDCHKVTDLMKLAWLAGKAGQSFDVKTTKKDDERR